MIVSSGANSELKKTSKLGLVDCILGRGNKFGSDRVLVVCILIGMDDTPLVHLFGLLLHSICMVNAS